ncbi:hypothetical protein ASD24_10030 [Paenibacillus sp. Root52]|uniref:hypothetical protein n=1 Tax=Paenibacillus sp. Root52 TaxID=1736552 RepID=UPI0006FD8589|nr:hypothetical protein [Paenibacillus sp. Root52]KQY84116.1 hypothetical protein ASD24_10030 [Paenibacillus sp. Root52]
MRKPFILFVILIISSLLLGACASEEKKAIVSSAEKFAANYISEKYGETVRFTEYKFSPPDLDKSLGLHGYIEGNKEQKVFVLVKYDPLSIETLSLPEEIRAKKPHSE